MAKKTRLDQALVERGLFSSREKAQRAIMAGNVRVQDRVSTKASFLIEPNATIEVEQAPPFVGRGGLKLAGALDHFGIDVTGQIMLDIGASTGGFTDCLLQRDASKVYAIDVGHGQMDWKIRSDPRVIVREKLNARFLSRLDIPDLIDVCVIDVSFISLTLILPNAIGLVTPSGVILALIKPQFELERADIPRGGVVRDPALHEKARNKIVDFVKKDTRLILRGVVPSTITGTDGNQEFFLCAQKKLA